MPSFESIAIKERNRREREIRESRITPIKDHTLYGVIRQFLNGWKIEFRKNNAYYILDPYGNCAHLSSYSDRRRMFQWIERGDIILNLYDDPKLIGEIVFAHTRKLNCWTGF